MIPISRETRARAWLAAVEHLLSVPRHVDHNVILEVQDPMKGDATDTLIEEEVDSLLRGAGANPLSTVAGTIFPAAAYVQFGPRGVYHVYPEEEYPEIASANPWGTYAHRLVRWPTGDGPPMHPLENCINKLRVELATPGPKGACYELTLSDRVLDLPIYDNAEDDWRHEGGPCLSHISLKVRNRSELFLTALYRSHWYVTKALGNLLGLAQLQAFICDETGLVPGPLVCVSTFARLDSGKGYGITAVRDLVTRVRAHIHDHETAAGAAT